MGYFGGYKRNCYFPKVTGKCLYMVNKYFITKDWESYRLDKDFILKVEALPLRNVKFLKANLPLPLLGFLRI